MDNIFTEKKAQLLTEVLLGIGILSLIIMAATTLLLSILSGNKKYMDDQKALSLGNECLEAIRAIRDDNFLNLKNGVFGLKKEQGYYELSDTVEKIESKYTRQVEISSVLRDANFNIAQNGATDDLTKKITCSVTYNPYHLASKEIKLTTYLSKWQNLDLNDSLISEFSLGTFSNTEAVLTGPDDTGDASVTLEIVTTPSGFSSSVNLKKSAMDVIVQGDYAYVAVDDDNEGLQIVHIKNPDKPKVVKTLNINAKASSIALKDNYLYIGTDKTHQGVVIVDITDPLKPKTIKTLDNVGKVFDILIDQNLAYVARNKFFSGLAVVDISDPLNPILKKEPLTIGEGKSIAIKKPYLFLGTNSTFTGLNILDLSNPFDPKIKAIRYVNGKVRGLNTQEDALYLAVENNQKGFAALNIENPLNPVITSTINLGASGNHISILDPYLYASSDLQNGGVSIIKFLDPGPPTLELTQDLQGAGRGSFPTPNYLYITTSNNARGLVILGVPKENFKTSGEYLSRILDTGSNQTKYYSLQIDLVNSPGGKIYILLRTADTIGHINQATFVGRDGTANSLYDQPLEKITLDPNASGKRFIQIKTVFEGNGLSSPVLNNVSINYRP